MTAPATPLPCPYCGAAMIWGGGESAWLHPERVIRCAAQATALRTATQLAAWDRRTPPSSPASDPASSIDHQQRIGAPLTFWTAVAAKAYRAEATRDDVRHEDAMRAALRAVETAMAEGRAPPPGQAALVEALQFYADRENWRGHNPLAPRVTQCALDEGSRARAALSSSPDDGRADAAGVG